MRETTASDIDRTNVGILVLGSVASGLIMRDFTYVFSFGVASAMMTLNFRLLKKIMESFFSDTAPSKKELLVKLPLKFFGLTGLVTVIVIWGNVNILFFIIGLGTVLLSVVISQVISVFAPYARRKHNGA
jgi:hypothetical protein